MASVSEKGVRFVAGWEGFRSCPYLDAVGVWTIGYGTTSATGREVNRDTSCISKERARSWLEKDLNERYLVHVPRRRRMRQRERDALASFVYNLGPGVMDPDRSTLARRLVSKEGRRFKGRRRIYRDELPKWVFADGRRLEGLVRRRAAEVEVAVNGDYSGRP